MNTVLRVIGATTILTGSSDNAHQPAATPPAGQKEAVAAINSAGGSVRYEEGNPNQPVTEVTLENAKLSETTLKAVAKLSNLKKLVLDQSTLTSDDLAHFKELSELESL